MLRRRWVRWEVAAALVLWAAGALFIALRPQPPGVTRANYERINAGMTLAEVEAVLGPGAHHPPNEIDKIVIATIVLIAVEPHTPDGETKLWFGSKCGIAVRFDAGKHVVAKEQHELPPSGHLARLRAWLGW
jgi:hypothetical protein